MSDFIDVDSFQPLKQRVREIKQYKRATPSQRQQYLHNIPPPYLLPNPERDDLFYIGGHFIPVNKMVGSIFTLGISRSGKTLQLKPSIATAIASLRRRGADRRVLITDAKQDMLPFVSHLTQHMGIPLYYFNLGDTRSIAYDLARDLGGRSDKMREGAKILIPIPKHAEPFWYQVPQTFVHATMLCLQKQFGYNWGLPDLYRITLMDIPQLIEFLSAHPVGKQIAAKYLPADRGGNTQFSFLSQLSSSLSQIELAASAQHYTPRSRWLSMEGFLRNRGVLLIGTSSDIRQATNPIVQLMFRTLTNKINLLPDSRARKVFIFLDELPFWGKLSGLDELLTFSPSKGAVTSLVCQDIQHLVDMYGREMADTIAGMCQTKLLFAPASSNSAQWAINSLGKREFRGVKFSTSFSSSGISETENTTSEYTYPITDGELRDLGLANFHTGSRFILSTPHCQPFIKYQSSEEISRWQPQESNIPLYVPRPESHFHVPPGRSQREEKEFLGRTMNNQQIYEEFMAGFQEGSFEQEMGKQMFFMLYELMNKSADDLLNFYDKRQSTQ